MAAKQKDNKRKNDKNDSILGFIKKETKQSILTVVFFVLAAIFVLASISKAGFVGDEIYGIFSNLFGIGYFLIPLFFLALSISFFRSEEKDFNKLKFFGGLLFFVSGLGIIDVIFERGGQVGWAIGTPVLKMFGFEAALIILFAFLVVSCLILFETKLTAESIMFWKDWKKSDKDKKEVKNLKIISGSEIREEKMATKEVGAEQEEGQPKKTKSIFVKKEDDEEFKPAQAKRIVNRGKYVPPPLSLLEDDKGRVVAGDIKANANIIKRTLQNFGMDVEMDEVSIGPSVTRYALKPAEGVKLAKIVALQNDLALALAAHPLRIEAPIPGKSLVGIEIPNTTKSTVGLASLVGSE